MKINLGSGLKRYDGFLNVDMDPLVEPDYLVDIRQAKLPFDDNSIEEIKAHHILEHIGEPFIPLMKELYRICKPGAILDILAPHHQHENYYGDPTHVRPITVNVMDSFSKKSNRIHAENIGSSSGIAVQNDIDFEIVHYEFEYDPFYVPMLENFFARKAKNEVTPEEDFAIQRLMREATNVALHTKILMTAVK